MKLSRYIFATFLYQRAYKGELKKMINNGKLEWFNIQGPIGVSQRAILCVAFFPAGVWVGIQATSQGLDGDSGLGLLGLSIAWMAFCAWMFMDNIKDYKRLWKFYKKSGFRKFPLTIK